MPQTFTDEQIAYLRDRERIANFADWAWHVLNALSAELDRNPDERLAALHAELSRYVPPPRIGSGHLGFAVPLQLRTRHGQLHLMTTITSFATAVDVTISELKLEAFLPADQATAAWGARPGAVLAGVSAGAICWFRHGVTDSHAGRLAVLECLGFLQGSCCPHYDGDRERRPAYHRFLLDGAVPPGVALDDGAAVHYVDSAGHRVVASRPRARGYRVCLREGAIQEEPLQTEYLANVGVGAPGTG